MGMRVFRQTPSFSLSLCQNALFCFVECKRFHPRWSSRRGSAVWRDHGGKHRAGGRRASPSGPVRPGLRHERVAGIVMGHLDQFAMNVGAGETIARHAGLTRAEHVAFAAQLEVFFGDDETILGVANGFRAVPAPPVPNGSENNSRQAERAAPRPTRPRSWCSWARPNRSACSTIMIVALGTSTPTSMTVVATRICASPDWKRAMAASFLAALILP